MTEASHMESPDPTGNSRPVRAIVPAARTLEGAGFVVYRPFPTAQLDLLDPFLLLDEPEPSLLPPGAAVGAPDHPHRGFETVTYILEGEVEHRDSLGSHGIIGPGEVQWMTAGDGIVHSEMPSARLQTEGGRSHGMQLWVNLPRSLKRTTPRYQSIGADALGVVTGDGWTAKVIAGTLLGATGPASTHTPIIYAHLTLQPGSIVRFEIPAEHNVGLYAFGGIARVGEPASGLDAQQLAVFEPVAGGIVITVADDADGTFDAMLLSGQPLNEPVARYGPFVMSTQAEIAEAIADYQAGRMGVIAATGSP